MRTENESADKHAARAPSGGSRRGSGDLLALAIFNAAYWLAGAGLSLARGNAEFLMYCISLLVIYAMVLVVHARVRLPMGLLWALSIWGVLHVAGGLVPVPESWPIAGDKRVLYSWRIVPDVIKYDMVVHAYGFGTSCWLCWCGWHAMIRGFGGAARPTWGALLLCVMAATGLGATNEILEFVAVLTVPDTNVGGYVNTGWDLVSNLAGAVCAAMLIRLGILRATTRGATPHAA
ncbi:MAG: hypothetical protein RBS39_01295 [Phycisphaerales bacterium]|jgi:hypothetical protein|nr:hypothetical protein [Phycisphaerales bacterium]